LLIDSIIDAFVENTVIYLMADELDFCMLKRPSPYLYVSVERPDFPDWYVPEEDDDD